MPELPATDAVEQRTRGAYGGWLARVVEVPRWSPEVKPGRGGWPAPGMTTGSTTQPCATAAVAASDLSAPWSAVRRLAAEGGSPIGHVAASLPAVGDARPADTPMVVKDVVDVAGMPLRNGTPGTLALIQVLEVGVVHPGAWTSRLGKHERP